MAVVDPHKVGLPIGTILFVEVPQNKLERVSGRLCHLAEVKGISNVTGKANLIAYVRVESNNGISEFLQNK